MSTTQSTDSKAPDAQAQGPPSTAPTDSQAHPGSSTTASTDSTASTDASGQASPDSVDSADSTEPKQKKGFFKKLKAHLPGTKEHKARKAAKKARKNSTDNGTGSGAEDDAPNSRRSSTDDTKATDDTQGKKKSGMEKLKEKIPGTEEHNEHKAEKEGKKSGDSDSDLSDSEKDKDTILAKDTVKNKDTVKDTAGRERDSNIRDKTMKDADPNPNAGRYKDGGVSNQAGTPDSTTLPSGRAAMEAPMDKDQGKAPISNQQPMQDQTKQPIQGQTKQQPIQDQSKQPIQGQSKQHPISDSKAKTGANDEFFGALANLRSEISHEDTNQMRGDVAKDMAKDDMRSGDRDRSDISKADKAAHLSNKDDAQKDTSRSDNLKDTTKQPVV